MFELPDEFLRVESPSAEVQGHNPDHKRLIHGKQNVGIIGIEPVGNYAIRIQFDDLHNTGIYTWEYLYELGTNQEKIWQEYLDKLAAKNLSREPKI